MSIPQKARHYLEHVHNDLGSVKNNESINDYPRNQ